MARRGNGEGSIYHRQDGRWAASLRVAGQRTTFYARTRREAQERLDAARQDYRAGFPVIQDRQTVAQFLGYWLENCVRPRTRPRTHESYAEVVRLHLLPRLGHVRLADLHPQHIQAVLNEKSQAGLSARTVQYVHSILHSALGQAEKWSLLRRNPAALVDRPRSVHREKPFLSPAEARHLLDAAQGERLEALYTVALALGLRCGEALGLRWDDVDIESGRLTVRFSLEETREGRRLAEPKSPHSRRTIAVPRTVLEALRRHRTLQLVERISAGPDWQDLGLVFSTHTGTFLSRHNVSRYFKRLLTRAGLPGTLSLHSLRHSCASLLVAQGVHPRVVMQTLGHSQIGITMEVYAHVAPELQREAADAIDRALGVA